MATKPDDRWVVTCSCGWTIRLRAPSGDTLGTSEQARRIDVDSLTNATIRAGVTF